MTWTPERLLAYLDELNIVTTTVSHPPVFTVEEAKRVRGPLERGHCKSLFLRNKKGAMWLVVLPEDRQVDLRRLGDLLGAGRLGFASPARLETHLGVIPGAVTPFAVVNETAGAVKVALDKELLETDPLHFHPLDNSQTTAVRPSDLLRFLDETGHPAILIEAADL